MLQELFNLNKNRNIYSTQLNLLDFSNKFPLRTIHFPHHPKPILKLQNQESILEFGHRVFKRFESQAQFRHHLPVDIVEYIQIFSIYSLYFVGYIIV